MVLILSHTFLCVAFLFHVINNSIEYNRNINKVLHPSLPIHQSISEKIFDATISPTPIAISHKPVFGLNIASYIPMTISQTPISNTPHLPSPSFGTAMPNSWARTFRWSLAVWGPCGSSKRQWRSIKALICSRMSSRPAM